VVSGHPPSLKQRRDMVDWQVEPEYEASSASLRLSWRAIASRQSQATAESLAAAAARFRGFLSAIASEAADAVRTHGSH
jgi:hypothetical protein